MAISISEIARKLNITNNELIEKAESLGFDIGKKAIKINENTAKQIIEKIKEEEKGKRGKEKLKKLQKEFQNSKKNQKKDNSEDKKERIISLDKTIIVHEFAQKLDLPVTKVISCLMNNGIMANLNQSIDFEIATIIAEELGFKTELKEENYKESIDQTIKKELKELIKEKNNDINSDLTYRAPVVVVMGHVDHGKTKLLDVISHTNKISKESGGITQHIGAFQVNRNGRDITFIDTPGHEAFQAMRARGGEVADVAILIVAANEGIKQQTIEAIKIIEEEKLPFVVAINKIDLPDANIDKVKSDLAELNLIPEEWGGNTICAPISAMKNQGIDELLDLVLLTVDIDKDRLLANKNVPGMGTVIESRIDKQEGVKASIILQTGSLKKGDDIIISGVSGRVKVIRNSKGKLLEVAYPGDAVEILGLKNLPNIGDILQVIDDKKEFKKKKKEYSVIENKSNKFISVKQAKEIEGGINVNVIIKSDFTGSSEALNYSLLKISEENPEVVINILKSDVGNINEGDVFSAEQSNAIILGFNVSVSPLASMLAREKKVKIKASKIIYELTDYIYDEAEALIPSDTKIDIVARAKVLKIFNASKKSNIIGCSILEGEIKAGDQFCIKNKETEEILITGSVEKLKIEKNEVKKVVPGNECGMCITASGEVNEGDILEFYKESQIKKQLKRS